MRTLKRRSSSHLYCTLVRKTQRRFHSEARVPVFESVRSEGSWRVLLLSGGTVYCTVLELGDVEMHPVDAANLAH